MFHTNIHGTRKAADNSGVCIRAADDSQDRDDFYGQLEEIIELEYSAMPVNRVTLFKCHQYDLTGHTRGSGTRVHECYQIVDIHINRSYGSMTHLYFLVKLLKFITCHIQV